MGKFKNFIFKTLVGGGLSLILLSLLNTLNVYTADAVTTYTEGGVTYTYKAKDGSTDIKRLIITGSGTVTDCWEDKLKNKSGTKYSTVIKQIQFNSTTLTAVDSDAFDDCTALNRVIISSYNNGNFNSTVFEGNTKITRLDLNDNITKVGNNAFKNCTNLATIELKNKVTDIGSYAFYKCKDTSITLPSTLTDIGDYAFSESELTSITIPATCTIGSYAFYDCDDLNTVTINEGSGVVHSYAFGSCTKITTVTIKGVTTIHDNAFNNTDIGTLDIKKVGTIKDDAFYSSTITTLKIAQANTIESYTFSKTKDCKVTTATISGVTAISSNCFLENENLEALTLTCTTIGDNAFKSCTELDALTLTNIVTIGSYAFYDIAETKVTLPSTLTTIGSYAFSCSSLTEITIPNAVTSVGIYAFAGCSDLAKVILKCPSLSSLNSNVFYNCSKLATVQVDKYNNGNFNTTAFQDRGSITKVDINSGITTIGNDAFKNCVNCSDLALDASVTSIGNYAFYKIKDKGVTLPSGLVTIGNYAFAESKLESLTVPAAVTTVGESAFYNCDSLGNVTIKSGVDLIKTSAFSNCSNLGTVTVENTDKIEHFAFAYSDMTKLYIKKVGTLEYRACKDSTITTVDIDSATTIEETALEDCEVTTLQISGVNTVPALGMSTSDLNTLSLSCKVVKSEAFKNCSSLTAITLSGIETIESYAFYDVADTDITLPNTLLTIGDYAFASSSLKKVTIPTNVTSLGNYAFSGCSSMTSVSFANCASNKNKLEHIGSNCFDSCNLSNFYVPFNIKTLGNDIFKSNSNLKAITLLCKEADSFGNNFGDAISVSSDGLNNTYTISKTLSDNSIKDIRIWKTVIKIPNFAFTNNTRLEFVRVPAKVDSATPTSAGAILTAKSNLSRSNTKVTSIGDFAFAGCSNLKVCYIPTQICEFGIESYNIYGSLTNGRQIGIGTAGIDLTVSHSVTPTADYSNSGVARVDVTTSFAGGSTSELSESQDYVFILDLTGSMDVAISYKLSDGTKEDGTKMKVSGRAFECLLDTLAEVSPDSRICVMGYYSNNCVMLADWQNYTTNKYGWAYGVAEEMKKGYSAANIDKYKAVVEANGGTWTKYCNKGEGGTDYRTGVLGAINFLVDKGWSYNKTNVLFMSDGGHNGAGNLDSVKAFGQDLSAFAKTIYSIGLCVEVETVDTTIDYSVFSLVKDDNGYITGVKLSDNSILNLEDLPDCYVITEDDEGNVTNITYAKVDLGQAYKTSKWLLAVSPYAKYYNVAKGDSVYNDFKNIFMRFIASSTSYISGLTLYDLYNEDVWEFVEDLTPSTVVYNENEGALSSVPTGKIYDEATDSFIANEGNGSFHFYVRLKDAYRTSNATYLVTDNAKGEAIVGVNGKLANIVVENTTPYYLDWFIHYNLLYNKDLTNN